MSLLVRLLLSPPACRDLDRLRRAVRQRTVLITGASFGIGAATAELLAEAGAELILLARSADQLDALVRQFAARGVRASAYPCDLYQTAAVPALVEVIERAHPRIDVVISNAGKSIRRRVTASFGRDDLERTIALNFASPAALLMALLPRMLAQGGGQVINVSTISAKHPSMPRWGTYQGTKAGFDIWLRSVANELRPRKLRVTSVYLPLVRTRMIAPTRLYDHAPALTPREAAEVLAAALVRPVDRLAPWWLWPTELLALLFTTPIHRVLTGIDRIDPT